MHKYICKYMYIGAHVCIYLRMFIIFNNRVNFIAVSVPT